MGFSLQSGHQRQTNSPFASLGGARSPIDGAKGLCKEQGGPVERCLVFHGFSIAYNWMLLSIVGSLLKCLFLSVTDLFFFTSSLH